MSKFVAEIIGTMLLIILGDGVVANVLLNKSKGQNSGWIVITTGWALGVAVAVYCVGAISGAHLNPAVTLGLAAKATSSRAIIFDYTGAIISTAQQEFQQIFPKPGWVEHDANEIWATQSSVASQALQKASLTRSVLGQS